MRYRILFVTVLLCFSLLKANGVFRVEKNNLNYNFEFTTNLTVDSLLQVLYSFEHLKKYSSGFTAITLVSEGENYYDVEFQIKYLFYSSKAVYRRSIIADSGLVQIEMLHFQQNSTIFPKLVKSKTEYRVVRKGFVSTITHVQSSTLSKPLNWIYLKVIRNKLDEFAQELKDYVQGLEQIKAE